jgi:hypothetical protein
MVTYQLLSNQRQRLIHRSWQLGLEIDVLEREQQGHHPEYGPYAHCLIPKFSTLAKGTRLTDERVALIQIGIDLLPWEKDLLMQVLYNREAVLS